MGKGCGEYNVMGLLRRIGWKEGKRGDIPFFNWVELGRSTEEKPRFF